MTPTNWQCHMDLDDSCQSFLQAWTIWTCHPIHLTSWQHWRSKPRRWLWWQLQPIVTGAFIHVADIDAPDERQHLRYLGDVSYIDRWQHVLFQWRASTSLLGYLVRRYLQLQWTKKCICPVQPFLYPSASTSTEKEAEHRDVFSQRRGVSQHTCEACG